MLFLFCLLAYIRRSTLNKLNWVWTSALACSRQFAFGNRLLHLQPSFSSQRGFKVYFIVKHFNFIVGWWNTGNSCINYSIWEILKSRFQFVGLYYVILISIPNIVMKLSNKASLTWTFTVIMLMVVFVCMLTKFSRNSCVN